VHPLEPVGGAALAIALPARVDPVNAITGISGSSTTTAPMSAAPLMDLPCQML
jgi:hypothetical protein